MDSLLCALCLLVRACKTRLYFEPLLKRGKKKGEKAKQRAQVSPAGILMHVLEIVLCSFTGVSLV